MTIPKIHCPDCNGKGKVYSSYGNITCLNCEGKGLVEQRSTFQRGDET